MWLIYGIGAAVFVWVVVQAWDRRHSAARAGRQEAGRVDAESALHSLENDYSTQVRGPAKS
ncbi:MAG TPA: hypothetical protein VNS61_10800 [Caldimonas sp.]|nr:hypothetical protein [Caldimonas sp.]